MPPKIPGPVSQLGPGQVSQLGPAKSQLGPAKSQLGPAKSQLPRQILTNDSEKNMNMVKNVKSPSKLTEQNVKSPSKLTEQNVKNLNISNNTARSDDSPSSVGSKAYSENSEIQYSAVSRASSSEPNSRQSSEPSSDTSSRQSLVPRVITPEPIPNSDTVYKSIQEKFNEIQQYTESIIKDDPKPITGSTRDNPKNNYLFVFLKDNLINFFESFYDFELGATFSYSKQNYLPNNYISKKDNFKSIFQIQKDKFITVDQVTDTNEYIGIGSFSPIITNTSIIEFYVYDSNSVLKETYYTYGNIFIYEHGIASTCEIVKAEIPAQLKNTILPHDTQVNANLKYEPKSSTIDGLILKIKSDVFGTTETLTKKQIIIHYLNAISPEDLKSIADLKAVAQVLFVNISCPTNGDVSIYNFLHKYVNYYYVYKSEKNTARKINEYINLETQYSPFAMHIFDFFEFLMFLKGKESTNPNLINCCIQIYNIYIANTEGFVNLSDNTLIKKIQDVIKKKQKKIHTYLQIIQDTTNTNEKYVIKLNQKLGVNGDTDSNNDKSMMLTYKTKSSTNTNPIFDTYEYKFGPFDKIYKSGKILGDDYEKIADDPDFKEIITKITSGSPMMISFHGPIGSARTKMSRKMIVSICNKLATEGYVNLDIEFQEFFRKHDGKESDEGVKNKISLKSSDSVFKIGTPTIPEPYHSTKTSKTIKINDPLDKLLEYYFDTDRITKRFSTYMDNSQSFDSPRSHVLCFCKMTKNGDDSKPLYIIFDDLAGNETKYDCTTEDFLKKIKGFKVKKDSNELFYENEFDANGENFDFYKGGDSTKDNMKKSKGTSEQKLYNELIRKACNNRSIEGDFINESLKEFRADLEYMVDVKNRDNKYYVPDIYGEQIDDVSIKTCLQDFCFGKTGCFQLKDVKDVKEPKSTILKSVYDYLNQKSKIDSATDFYDKLEVCIFGFFNISEKITSHLNEPPNYIDINNVKSIIYGKDEFTFNNNPGVFEAFKTALTSSATYTSRLSVLYARFPEKYVNELLELCKDVFSSDVRQNAITTLTLAQIETFKGVFDAIDDENAKTAIGTLEFMNKISKFNVVNSICYKKNDGTNYV
jgi:hypothetical protein